MLIELKHSSVCFLARVTFKKNLSQIWVIFLDKDYDL